MRIVEVEDGQRRSERGHLLVQALPTGARLVTQIAFEIEVREGVLFPAGVRANRRHPKHLLICLQQGEETGQ